jgi:hypothetical protein
MHSASLASLCLETFPLQRLDDSPIRRRERVLRELLTANPANLLTSERARRSTKWLAFEDMQGDPKMGIRMSDRHELPANAHAQSDLFPDLARAASAQALSRLTLPPGEFPEAS